LGQTCRNATSVNSANFQSNYSAVTFPSNLEEPVSVFLALHPADDAPTSVSMRNGQCYCFRAILGNAILVVLINLT
jgi:hypothetical protein